ncbi:MAG: hypothetical protein RI968_545, partial [Pseudomonadota bacterium]
MSRPSMRDPEAGLHALEEIQAMLARFRVESELVHREQMVADPSRRELVEQLVAKQQTAALAPRIRSLHAADIAFVLEALPPEHRQLIWPLVPEADQADVMVELPSPVRVGLIGQMTREALLQMAQGLDTDDLAAMADELPQEVIDRVQQGLS